MNHRPLPQQGRDRQMNALLATVVYCLGILGLFYLNRDNAPRTSKALWIPVIWFWIIGSRAVSIWLDIGSLDPHTAEQLEGSPTDAFIFGSLIVSGVAVLALRGRRAQSLIEGNWPIVWYFAFCLISVVWSDYPDVSLKRWVKSTGDFVMALVVFTDAEPVAAVRRLLSRVGFVLLPMSILLIKYYPYLGRSYDPWGGEMFNTGVTTNKNMLGVSTYILAMGALWQVLRLRKEGRFRHLLAQSALLGLGVWVLCLADSATSTSCFLLGSMILVMTGSPRSRRRPAAVHALVLGIVLLGGFIKVTGADTLLIEALGRKPDLTGRASEIWPLLFPMAPNVVGGAGFETFWLGPRLHKVWNAFPNLYLNEAHNGYLEVYLNLGMVGVGLLLAILVHGYRRSIAAFRIDPHAASLILSYILSAVVYSYAEAGFRMLSFGWGFLLLAVVGANRLVRDGERAASIAKTLAKTKHPSDDAMVLVTGEERPSNRCAWRSSGRGIVVLGERTSSTGGML